MSSQRAAACKRENSVSTCELTTKGLSPRSDGSSDSRGSTPKRPSNLLVFAGASLVVSQFAFNKGQEFEEENKISSLCQTPLILCSSSNACPMLRAG